MSTDLIVLQEINTTPAVINFDFEGSKLRLEARLEPFKTVVTEDTIAQAKKEKAEINKLKAEIDDARKTEAAKATVGVRLFEDQMKELAKLCADGYSHLNDQINKFEAIVKAKCLGFLQDDLLDAWEQLGVKEEFRKATVDHLALLGNCNDAGIPNKKAKKLVFESAEKDLHTQTKITLRLSQLEAECYKAGLKVPLSRVHVNGFLFADDAQYSAHLAELISEEVDRTKKAEAAFFELQPAQSAPPESDAAPAPNAQSGFYSEQRENAVEAESGKTTYVVTVLIQVTVDPHITMEMIAASARKQMTEKAGFKNIKSIQVGHSE